MRRVLSFAAVMIMCAFCSIAFGLDPVVDPAPAATESPGISGYIWSFLNSPLFLTSAVAALAWLFQQLFLRSPIAAKYKGFIISSMRAAEKALPDGKSRLDDVLQKLLARMEADGAAPQTDAAKQEVVDYINLLHSEAYPTTISASALASLINSLKKVAPVMILLALPFLAGCLNAPEPVLKGHDAAADCVAKSSAQYGAAIRGLEGALRDERKSNVEAAMSEMFALIRADSVTKPCDRCQATGAVDGKPCPVCEGAKNVTLVPASSLKKIQAAIQSRDVQLLEIEKTIAKYRATAALGEREVQIALSFMGKLRAYDAAGVDPAKVAGQLSEIVPARIP